MDWYAKDVKILDVIFSCKTRDQRMVCADWLLNMLYKDLIVTEDYKYYMGVLNGGTTNKDTYLQPIGRDKQNEKIK